jgi:ribonuclease Z
MQQRYLAKLNINNIEILGFSMAGEESVVAAPEFNVIFDIGRAPQDIINLDYVLLTHGHMDHAAGIAYYFSQRNFLGNPGGTVVLPRPLAGPIRRLMQVWAEIEGHPSPANIIPLDPGGEHTLRRNLVVRAFPVPHGAPTLGYSIIEHRHKLKPEFASYSGRELAEMKRKGVQIEYNTQVPMVAYCGDSPLGDYLDLPHVSQAKVVILECTFFDPDHVVRARAGRHMHAIDMPEAMRRIQSEHVLLFHLSRRTSMAMARRVLKDLLPKKDMDRITFLMDRKHLQDPRPAKPTLPERPGQRPQQSQPPQAPKPGEPPPGQGM